MDKPQIALIPDTIFQIGPISITSGHMAMFLITSVIFFIALYTSRTASLKPTRLQVVFEFMMTWFLDKTDFAFKSKKVARRVFPLIMTMFLVIICGNLFSLIPLVEAITVGENPLFRAPTSDISMTLSLGVFAVVLSHVLALLKAPIKHIGRFINIGPFFKVKSFGDFMQASLDFALGLNDIIGEFAKVVSVSFRLFGNIFSGVAVAAVFAFLAPYLIPIPFFALGAFSGVIQSVVFSLLALQYLSSTLGALDEEN